MARWIIFVLWTAFVLYTMDVFKPSESRVVGTITQWFVDLNLPPSTPAKVYHWWVFFVWSFLLAGALARGYWRLLPPRHLAVCVGSLAVFGVLTESLQHLNPARTPALFDAALNLFGGGLGLCLRAVACRLLQAKPRLRNGYSASKP